jgi:hypothetical protein
MFYDHDWQGAERELKRAIDLNPGAAFAHQRYGSYLTFAGRFEESLSETVGANSTRLVSKTQLICLRLSR